MATSAPRTRASAIVDACALGYVALFALALLVRGAYFLELASSPFFRVLVGDGRHYHAWALEIAGGNWLGEDAFYQAPLYPYAMAVLVRVFGPELWPIRLLQMILGSASCVLIAMTGRRLFSYPAGLVAGGLLALYPPAIFFDGLIQKTSVSLFLTAVLLALVGILSERDEREESARWKRLWLSGVVLSALALTRENALILFPALGVWIVFRADTWPRRMKELGWFAAGLAVVMVPVAVRNFVVADAFLPTTSQLGTNFYIGNNAAADGRYRPLLAGRQDARVERDDAVALAEAAVGRELAADEVSNYWLGRSSSYIRSEPTAWALLLVRKASLLFNAHEIVDSESIEAYGDGSAILRVSHRVLHWGVLGPLALVGLWATRRQWQRLAILYAMELSLAASLILFYVMARYRAPLIPIAALFAGVGIVELFRSFATRSLRQVAAYVVLAGIAYAVQNRPLPIDTDPRATTYYNVGVALLETGESVEARAAFEETIRIQPRFAEGHFSLANVLFASGQRSRAMEHYRTTVRLEPNHANAHLRLARILADAGRHDEAIRHYRAVVETPPNDATILVNVAHQLSQLGQTAEAMSSLERALSIAPDNAMAHNLLANILAYEGRPRAAVEHYEAALVLDPELTDAHFKLGVLFSERGWLEAALPHLEETTRLVPDFAEGYFMLAVVLERLGRTNEAALAHRRARELERL